MVKKRKSSPPRPPRPKRTPNTFSPVSRVVPATVDGLFERVATILDQARGAVVRSVNNHMVLAYWHIGREIVRSLQGGDERAEYGKRVVAELSGRLATKYGRGFSTTYLWYFRQFYVSFSDRTPEIRHKACGESGVPEKLHKPCGESLQPRRKRAKQDPVLIGLSLAIEHPEQIQGFSARLSWSHYRALIGVAHRSERLFYEIEAEKDGWSVPHLERQIHTLLFARLLKSRDREGVLALARKGQVIEKPIDALKDPYVLDFLDLPDGGRLRESDLEQAIIGQLQNFLLELGKGFAFVARQKRLAYEDEHFYVDLVFYHTILKCYVLIDLKIGKLSHQDIGQMDSYVRLFDDQFTTEEDNPTIGLVLCAEKNEAVARYSVLNESKQVFAAKYVKHLPTEAELQREIARERRLIDAKRAKKGDR